VGLGLDASRIDEDDEEYKSESSEEDQKKRPFEFGRKMSINSYKSQETEKDKGINDF
jgi:hypothetical protein